MNGLPGEIDPAQFCRLGEVLAFAADVAHFPRLSAEFTQGMLTCRLTGTQDSMGQKLVLAVSGEVGVVCQRCLSPMPFVVKVAHSVRLAKDDIELERLDIDPNCDAIPLLPKLDPVALIEDDVLLSLPMATMHDVGQCPV